jgi:hypothetical protein
MSLHPPVCALCHRASGPLVHAACLEAKRGPVESTRPPQTHSLDPSRSPEAKQFAWWDLTRLFPDPTAPIASAALRPATFPLPNPANFRVSTDLQLAEEDDALL